MVADTHDTKLFPAPRYVRTWFQEHAVKGRSVLLRLEDYSERFPNGLPAIDVSSLTPAQIEECKDLFAVMAQNVQKRIDEMTLLDYRACCKAFFAKQGKPDA